MGTEMANITRMAAYACRTRTAALSVVDDAHEHFVASYGCNEAKVRRDTSLASLAIDRWRATTADAESLFLLEGDNGAGHHSGLYAAVPILSSDHRIVAVLSVTDDAPRPLDLRQIAMLRMLAGQASTLLCQSQRIHELSACQIGMPAGSDAAGADAQRDPLTELPNRAHFIDRVTETVDTRRKRRRKETAAVLFVDLDRFKRINDTLGHAAGDILLREVAQRFRNCLSPGDILARLGGDEFTVLLPHLTDPDYAENVARTLIQAVARPIKIRNEEVQVGASVGISMFPRDGEDAGTLLKNADIAMYQAKANGGYQAYSQTMNADGYQRLLTETALRHAIEREEILVAYQPQYNLATGELHAVEALARWRHPERGPIPPSHFIAVAEQADLIIPLGLAVLRRVCRDAAMRRSEGLPMVRVAMNLSGRQLMDQYLHERILEMLEHFHLSPSMLDLELTETTLALGNAAAPEMLQALRGMGTRLLVDDFGTGYSSLAYLRHFQVDGIKIDQTFTAGLGREDREDALVKTLVDMAHALRVEAVAEGVETAHQVRRLQEFGCDVGQGYLFHKPLSAEDLRAVLLANQPHPAIPVDTAAETLAARSAA